MRKFRRLLVWALACAAPFVIPACSDDDPSNEKPSENPSEVIAETSGLEWYGYSLPFEIKSDKAWKIEFDEAGEEIACASPAQGTGNATVTLYVLDNLEAAPRTGTMTVTFPEDPSQNKVIQLTQKQRDNGENYDAEVLGSATYGVGYGFDLTEGVSPTSVRIPIVLKDKLQEAGMITVSARSVAEFHDYLVTGSTLKELTNELKATMSLKWSGKGLETEANATFKMNDYQKNTHEYALAYIDAILETLQVNGDPTNWADNGSLTDDAAKALSGEKDKYASTDQGFFNLCQRYGTHVIVNATLGARARMSTVIDVSEVKKEYDLKAFGSLSYKGIVEAKTTVDDTFKESFKENTSAMTSNLTVYGGSKTLAIKMSSAKGDELATAAAAWKEDLGTNEKSWTFVGVTNDNDLVPLWELISDKARAAALEEFVTSGRYEAMKAAKEYNYGEQIEIDDPATFVDTGWSLIKEVTVGGNRVALICNEYIPQIDATQRVNVIYPVINGKTKWNLGLFVGNDYKTPMRVSTYGNTISLKPYAEMTKKGALQKVYLRGASFSAEPFDESTEIVTSRKDSYRAYIATSDKSDDHNSYSLVKWNNYVWLRDYYEGVIGVDNKKITDLDIMRYYEHTELPMKTCTAYYYHPWKATWMNGENVVAPAGWDLPDAAKVEGYLKELQDYGLNAKMFAWGGVVGLNLEPRGYVLEESVSVGWWDKQLEVGERTVIGLATSSEGWDTKHECMVLEATPNKPVACLKFTMGVFSYIHFNWPRVPLRFVQACE